MNFESEALRVRGIIIKHDLDRSKFVHEQLFPRVRVSSCDYKYVDFIRTHRNKDGDLTGEASLLNFKPLSNTELSCYSTIREENFEGYVYQHGSVKPHGRAVPLTECCLSACGGLPVNVEAHKATSLADRILLSLEVSAMGAAFDESIYDAAKLPNVSVPTIGLTAPEGAVVDFEAKLDDPNFDIIAYFDEIQQARIITGPANKLFAPRKVLDKMRRHPSVIDVGCIVANEISYSDLSAKLNLMIVPLDLVQNNAAFGQPAKLSRIVENKMLLVRVIDDLSFINQNPAATFGWSAYVEGYQTDIYKDRTKLGNRLGPSGGVDYLRIAHDYTPHIAMVEAATLFTNLHS